MHASLRIGEATVTVSDGTCSAESDFQGFSLSVTVGSIEMADRLFGALAKRGQVQMPLSRTFWSLRFGMVTDRFGVAWMVHVNS